MSQTLIKFATFFCRKIHRKSLLYRYMIKKGKEFMTKILIGNTLVVKISGEMDHSNSNKYRHEIDREIKGRPVKNLVFDFKDLDFMDSSGIGMILGRYKTIKGLDGNVMIAAPNQQVEKIINISGLHKIIPVYESVDRAINSMREVACNG